MFMAASFFACFCSAFGLSWTPKSAVSGTPLSGLLSVCNSVADQMGRTDYLIWKRFAGGFLEDGTAAPQGMFLSISLILLMILFVMIIGSGYRLVLLLTAAPPVAMMLISGSYPGPWEGLAFAFAMSCGLILMSGGETSPWILALPLVAVMLTLGAGILMDHGNGIAMGKVQRYSTEKLQEWVSGRTGSNPLESGKLDELEGKKLRELRGSMEQPAEQLSGNDLTETALEVKMEDPRAVYLRGFVGEVYEGSRWKALDNSEYYEQRDQLYWLNQRGFDGLSQLSQAAAAVGDYEEGPQADNSMMEISVKDADRSPIYIPYELVGTDKEIPEGTQNYAGAFLKTDRIAGSRNYSLQIAPDLSGRWTDLAGRLFSTSAGSELSAYFENESRYNVWCYEHYTAIPDEMHSLLEAAVGDPGDLSRTHADYKETIALIRDYLDGNFICTENFDKAKEGEDAIESFLLTGKGCDAHYAGLGSLLFRWYGIPARYVEGYIVTPEDAENAKATQAMKIGTSHAHAWTEIYVDGLGWVPIEVTTAYRDIMPEADLEKGLEAIVYENQPREQEEEQTEDLVTVETPEYGRAFLRILLIAAGVLLLLILIWILRKLIIRYMIKRRRQRAFADPDPRKGICAMYGYLLREGIPCSEKAESIGNLAAFSNNNIEEIQRVNMRREMEWGEDEKKLLEKNQYRSPLDRLSDLWVSLRGK